MMWDWQDGLGGWGWFWMIAMMALVWIPLVLAVVWMLRPVGGPSRPSMGPEDGGDAHLDAVEIARRSYARGDLPRERYLQIIDDLQQGGELRGGG